MGLAFPMRLLLHLPMSGTDFVTLTFVLLVQYLFHMTL
ncbi:hypothetical protein SAMN04489740_4196 [Arthrobacter alpinus]|uniref:Uncharacterized protein n=1 Tax=Arthrobacter alpinus TaxID=656366 RepID=A0A1H5PEY4_9MICC|nr:hypothetical protein SAMN04489740_4196 [Arthrobacter alpinus]